MVDNTFWLLPCCGRVLRNKIAGSLSLVVLVFVSSEMTCYWSTLVTGSRARGEKKSQQDHYLHQSSLRGAFTSRSALWTRHYPRE